MTGGRCGAPCGSKLRSPRPRRGIRAHLDDVETFGVGALEHPCFSPSWRATRSIELLVPKAFRRKCRGMALPPSARERRVPRLEIEPRLKGDDLFRTGRFAKPALHAQAFGKSQHRAGRIVRQRPRRTGGDTGMAKRATLDVEIDATERAPAASGTTSTGAGAADAAREMWSRARRAWRRAGQSRPLCVATPTGAASSWRATGRDRRSRGYAPAPRRSRALQ